jgi:hypothetical protein
MSDGNAQVPLSFTEEEKDLGVKIDTSLNFDSHIRTIANKANQMTGLLWRCFEYIDITMFNSLYKSLIRPHMEYAVSTWSPSTWKHAEILERVQRRATHRVPALKSKKYHERLRYLKLPTLVYRRIRGDLINTYKYLTKAYDSDCGLLPSLNQHDTRGHYLKLRTIFTRTERHKNFFSNRVIAWWNSLPQEVVSAPTVNAFKNRVDKHFSNHPVMYDYRALDSPSAPRMSVY